MRRESTKSRACALVLAAFRTLAFLVAVQCSGTMHFAIDAIELMDGRPHVTDNCTGEHDDCPAGCPPGCPTCHCGTGFLASLAPHPDSSGTLIHLITGEVRSLPREDRVPASAERTSVFRPPRPLVLLEA